MKQYLCALFALCIASMLPQRSFSQGMEQVTTGELKAGDVIYFQEVMTELAMSSGARANLVTFDPSSINIQFIVEGDAENGYHFLLKSSSDGIADNHAETERYLSGEGSAWDISLKTYKEANCTWLIVADEEEGIFKIKNTAETGNNYVGVNYGDAGAGYPLWRDKGDFPYSELGESSAYGIFWKIFKSSLKNDLEHWFTIALEKIDELTLDSNGIEEMLAAIDKAQIERDSQESTEESVAEAVEELKIALFNYLTANASQANPMDITIYVVDNADMEKGSAAPWINATSISDFHTGPVNANISPRLSGSFLQTWNSAADAAIGKTGRVYQSLSGLPNGLYSLEAGYTEMWEGQETDEVIETGTNVFLFGNTQHTELVIDKLSRYGFPETGGRLGVVEGIQVTDGTLEIGVRYEVAHMTVSALDNVRLIYYGFDLSGIIEALSAQVETAQTYAAQKMQASVAESLNSIIGNAEETLADVNVTKKELEETGLELGAAIRNAQASIALYEKLQAAITTTNEFYESIESGDGSAILSTIQAAQGTYNTATADEAAINETITVLKASIWNFQVQNATPESPLNMTSWVKNADMQIASPLSWINETNITDFHTQPVNANIGTYLTGHFLQTWNNTADAEIGKTGRVYQTINNLPNGYYILKAAYTEMWEGQEEDIVIETGTGIYLYANEDSTELIIDKLSRFGFPETGGRQDSIENIYVTNGTLEIGIRYYEAHMTVSALDNVELYYIGSDPTALDEIEDADKSESNSPISVYATEGGVTLTSATTATVSVFSISGQLLQQIQVTEGENFIPLPKGSYIIGNQTTIVSK